MKSKMSTGKIILWVLVAIGILFIVWFGISYIDIITNNGNEGIGPQLSWNLFKVFNFGYTK